MKEHQSSRPAPTPKRMRFSETARCNAAIIPASQLAAMKQWQQKANKLPVGGTLLVLPNHNPRMQEVGRRIRVSLQHVGCKLVVSTVR